MEITFTTTADALYEASQILHQSLRRGDFDEAPEFDAAAARTAGRFAQAAATADDHSATEATVTVDADSLDEVLAVLESDRQAAKIAPLVTAASVALAAH